MTTYDRTAATGYEPIDWWVRGVGWLAHPDEVAQRASQAVRGGDERVWIVDPIDAPGVDDLFAELGRSDRVLTPAPSPH